MAAWLCPIRLTWSLFDAAHSRGRHSAKFLWIPAGIVHGGGGLEWLEGRTEDGGLATPSPLPGCGLRTETCKRRGQRTMGWGDGLSTDLRRTPETSEGKPPPPNLARHTSKCGCQWEWECLSRCVGRGHCPAGERGWEDRSQRRTDNPTEAWPARSLASLVTATAASYSCYSYFIGGAGGPGHLSAPFFFHDPLFTVRVSRDTLRLADQGPVPQATRSRSGSCSGSGPGSRSDSGFRVWLPSWLWLLFAPPSVCPRGLACPVLSPTARPAPRAQK